MLKTGYTVDYSELNILRQGRRKPLQIHFVSFSSARLDKYLMSLLLGEADYFILNARAIAGADAVDFARIQGRAVQILKNDLLGLGACVGYVAGLGIPDLNAAVVGENGGVLVAELRLEAVDIDAAAIHAGRSARFEAAGGQTEALERSGKLGCGKHPVGAALV